MWFAWHGGWCWGPRLIIPGLVPAIAAIGPWLVDADASARRRAAVRSRFRGLVTAADRPDTSAAAGRPRPRASGGPFPADAAPWPARSPWRQFQLIGPTVRYSLEHRYKGLDDGRNYLRYLSLWQVGLTRRLQRTGLLVSVTSQAC